MTTREELRQHIKEEEAQRQAYRDMLAEELLDDQLETMQSIFNTSL